jgi:hypothetical protein
VHPLLSLANVLPYGAMHAFPCMFLGQATTFGTVLIKPTLRATTRSMAGGFASGPRLRVLGFSHLIYFASPSRPECLLYRNKQDFANPHSFAE